MIYSTIAFTVAPGKNFEANEYFHTVVRQVKKLNGTDVAHSAAARRADGALRAVEHV